MHVAEVANGATLFIDEISEMLLALQTKLLRVLEDGAMRKVGSQKERKVDILIIPATNRDLADAVANGGFRKDLYYRINVMFLQWPPLRKRESHIGLLIDHFVGDERVIAPDARDAMESYEWSSNIR